MATAAELPQAQSVVQIHVGNTVRQPTGGGGLAVTEYHDRESLLRKPHQVSVISAESPAVFDNGLAAIFAVREPHAVGQRSSVVETPAKIH